MKARRPGAGAAGTALLAGCLLGAYRPAYAEPAASSGAAAAPAATAGPVGAQMTFDNGDSYRGDVLVTAHDPLPTQPGPGGRIAYDDGKVRPGYAIPDGPGTFAFAGYTLTGTFSAGLAEGAGTLSGPGGLRYDGSFAHGAPQHGTIVYPSGDTYAGDFAGGCFSGPGTYRRASGDTATGTWQPVTDGSGACRGSRFAGSVTAGGVRYDGPLDESGKRDGTGSVTDRAGRILTGTWSHGAYTDRFTQQTAAGWKTFQVDVVPAAAGLDGPGTYFVLDGSTVSGRFHGGELSGPAMLTTPGGKRIAGNVFDERFVSYDHRTSEPFAPFAGYDGSRDRFGRPDGFGRMRYHDGDLEWIVRGTWRHGLMSGVMVAHVLAPNAPTFSVDVGRGSNVLGGPAVVRFAHKTFREEGTLANGALEGPGSVRYATPPYCRLDGTFRSGVLRHATERCPGEAPRPVDIAADGTS